MILAIDEGDANGKAAEGFGRVEAGEPATENENVGRWGTVHGQFPSRTISRRQRAKRSTSRAGGIAASSP